MKYLAFSLAVTVALWASRADSQTFTTLLSFTGTGGTAIGANPNGSLTLSGTTFYGVTNVGGSNGFGNVFSVGTDGTNYQNLLSFTGTAGAATGLYPKGGLALSGTTLYGTTVVGGAYAHGTVFSIATNGTNFQDVVDFSGSGGAASGDTPGPSLTLSGTTLYGVTADGGSNRSGNVFSVGVNGSNYQNLLSFTGSSGAAIGDMSYGGLTLSGTTLYGVTGSGGNIDPQLRRGYGNLFSVGVDGSNYWNLLSFTDTGGAASGETPDGRLILSGTMLYGMTFQGGSNAVGNVYRVGVNGTNYQNLLSFTGSGGAAIGWEPLGSLTLSGTTLYGTTRWAGANFSGNIFSLGIDGSNYQNLYTFTGGTDGAEVFGDLTLSGGTLFGMTSQGGANGDGTVFALALPTPEPGTLAVAEAAAAVVVAYRWRRRRRNRW